jgi:opacity protein-like surface antigen
VVTSWVHGARGSDGCADCGLEPTPLLGTAQCDRFAWADCDLDFGTNPCCAADFCCGGYFSAFGGWANAYNFERTIEGDPVEIDGASLLDGWAGGGAVGLQWFPHLRNELEYTFRDNNAENWFHNEFTNDVLTASTVTPATGELNTHSFMLNTVFDAVPRNLYTPSVYIGGGIGILYADGDIAAGGIDYEVSDTSFAYQFLLGLNYPLSMRLDAYTEFRYLGADYLGVDDNTNNVALGDFNIDTASVLVGIRLRR